MIRHQNSPSDRESFMQALTSGTFPGIRMWRVAKCTPARLKHKGAKNESGRYGVFMHLRLHITPRPHAIPRSGGACFGTLPPSSRTWNIRIISFPHKMGFLFRKACILNHNLNLRTSNQCSTLQLRKRATPASILKSSSFQLLQ
jgi:hypothetical protein